MLKWLIRNRLAAFERAHAYDASYMREILAADTRAFLKFARVAGIGSYRRDVPLDVYYGAKLTAVIAEDCGPCTQLVVGLALADRADPKTIATIVAGDETKLGEEARLGVEFARAVLAHGTSLSAADISVALDSAGTSAAEWSVQLASDDVRDGAFALRLAHGCRRDARTSGSRRKACCSSRCPTSKRSTTSRTRSSIAATCIISICRRSRCWGGVRVTRPSAALRRLTAGSSGSSFKQPTRRCLRLGRFPAITSGFGRS